MEELIHSVVKSPNKLSWKKEEVEDIYDLMINRCEENYGESVCV